MPKRDATSVRPRPKPACRFPPFPRSVRSRSSRCSILTFCRSGGLRLTPVKEEPRRRKREGRPRLNAGTLGGPCRAPQVYSSPPAQPRTNLRGLASLCFFYFAHLLFMLFLFAQPDRTFRSTAD